MMLPLRCAPDPSLRLGFSSIKPGFAPDDASAYLTEKMDPAVASASGYNPRSKTKI
jgi:hypothetical protein